ncbi:hypothetical protein Patl1_15600 [Pistacia atlantica]|uniref:Uncharacterized protein n=1 Tax=Pistacia atlantica TaxID=434234 RepID=A0ACC1B9D0_9ROSI|nr:hypothetical protein Patl1_15600 [Pistacia atlantica]
MVNRRIGGKKGWIEEFLTDGHICTLSLLTLIAALISLVSLCPSLNNCLPALDSIERFHISAFLLFVLAQNILEAEGPWFKSFIFNALMVYICEMLIDIIKHSFLAKFNGIKPIAYSEYLEDLCKQTLNIKTEHGKKILTFVPLAPACVVIRVLTPVFAARLPCNPLPLRLFWIFFLSAITYVMLTSLKVMIGMGLQKHATWYVERCRKRKHHLHYD